MGHEGPGFLGITGAQPQGGVGTNLTGALCSSDPPALSSLENITAGFKNQGTAGRGRSGQQVALSLLKRGAVRSVALPHRDKPAG